MNKWIEQEAEKWDLENTSFTPDGPRYSEAWTAGAQAMLARVKEIIEESKANDFGEDCGFDAGRESLRQEILEKLK